MKEQVLSLKDYYKDQFHRYGWKLFTKTTDTHYPFIFALGIYHSREDLCKVARVGKWELRLEHERGHRAG